MQSGPSANRDIEKMIKLLKTVQVLNFKMTKYIKNHYAMMAVVQD